MGNVRDKPGHQILGPKDQTDSLGRNGRSVFAERTMIESGAFEDMSNLTAGLIPLPTTNIEMEVVSSSSDDSASGSGARTVLVVALGEDLTEKPQIITLGGLTPEPVITNIGSGVRRINSFLVQSVGSERGAAIGTIVIRDKNNPNVIFSQIDPGENSSAQSLRTVPANTTISFIGWMAAARATSKVIKFRFQTSFNEVSLVNTPGVFTTRDVIDLQGTSLYKPFSVPFVIPGGTDLIINAKIESGGGNGDGMISYQYFIQRS